MPYAPQRDPDAGHQLAYAERLRDAFRVFAENISMGQNENNCKERFARSLDLIRKARDIALDSINGVDFVEPTADPNAAPRRMENTIDSLSTEDQRMIEQVLDRTTGAKATLDERNHRDPRLAGPDEPRRQASIHR